MKIKLTTQDLNDIAKIISAEYAEYVDRVKAANPERADVPCIADWADTSKNEVIMDLPQIERYSNLDSDELCDSDVEYDKAELLAALISTQRA